MIHVLVPGYLFFKFACSGIACLALRGLPKCHLEATLDCLDETFPSLSFPVAPCLLLGGGRLFRASGT